MRHLRIDYDRIQDPEGKIPADEPVFLLRGQDPVACRAVHVYAGLLEEMGGDPEMVRQAYAWASRMGQYADRVQHGLPTVPLNQLRAVAQGAGHLSVVDARAGLDGK